MKSSYRLLPIPMAALALALSGGAALAAKPKEAASNSWITVSGGEFALDTGIRDIKVDTESMSYNPLDDTGFQQVDVGNRVRITGNVDQDLFELTEIDAETLVTLYGS